MHGFERVTLANLAGGGAEEVFQRELGRVLADIEDPNKRAVAKRKIVLTVDFEPKESRDGCEAKITYQTTLARPIPTAMPVFFRKNLVTNAPEAIQFQAKQVDIFEGADAAFRGTTTQPDGRD